MISDTITVYWAPSRFVSETGSWNMLYRAPTSVSSRFKKLNTSRGDLSRCPASNDLLKNLYSFDCALEDEFDIPVDFLKSMEQTEDLDILVPTKSALSMYIPRKSSMEGHANVAYNMGWSLFADEPLVMRATAPYYPAVTPMSGAILASGEYDIGLWFRAITLDYHVPYTTNSFKVSINDPLIYLDFKTNKKIRFKRFIKTQKIELLEKEFSYSPRYYAANKPLDYRYDMSRNAELPKIVLSEIKKNLVD
jgi:hypothetical protein